MFAFKSIGVLTVTSLTFAALFGSLSGFATAQQSYVDSDGIGSSTSATPTTYTLRDAVNYGYVTATISGRYSYDELYYGQIGYYGQVITAQLNNKSTSSLTITVTLGLRLVPQTGYSAYQTMLLSKEQIVYLTAGENETVYLYAFCAEFYKEIPTYYVYYDLGSVASGDTLIVLQEIDSQGLYDSRAAQLALWTITDYVTVADTGDDQSTANAAQAILDSAGIGDTYRFVEKGEGTTVVIVAAAIVVVLLIIGGVAYVVRKGISSPRPARPSPPPAAPRRPPAPPEEEARVSPRPKPPPAQIESQVFGYIKSHRGEIDIGRCAKKLGISEDEVERAVRSLVKKGKIAAE